MSSVALFSDLPSPPPQLDHVAVEQARLTRLARDYLATEEPSIDYDGLAAGRLSTVLAARQWVKRQRAAQRVVIVEHGGRTLIPAFQLDEVFDLNTATTPTIEALTQFGMSGWAMWQWFTAINPWIDARPVDVIDQANGTELLAQAVAGLVHG